MPRHSEHICRGGVPRQNSLCSSPRKLQSLPSCITRGKLSFNSFSFTASTDQHATMVRIAGLFVQLQSVSPRHISRSLSLPHKKIIFCYFVASFAVIRHPSTKHFPYHPSVSRLLQIENSAEVENGHSEQQSKYTSSPRICITTLHTRGKCRSLTRLGR